MSSKLFLIGDSEPLICEAEPDVLLDLLERVEPDAFMRVEMSPYARDEHSRPAYLRPSCVSAVMPMHPREREHWLDNPPEWLED
jgi:hypothetical protein